MGKAFNEGYALWMFDDMCRAFGIDSRDIPTCLREHVAHIIANQSVDDDWSFCKWHTPYLHRNLWNRLIKYNPEMEGYLQQIRTHHFVAIKINACRDFSIVKFSERKTGVWRDELAESRLVDYLTLRQGKIVDTILAESVKVIMPHDVRIKSGYGNYTLLPGRTYLARHRTMTVYSDRWAADHERPLPFKASGISWIIWFSPTRSPIIAPTMWLSLVAMMACMLWAFLGITYNNVSNGFLFGVSLTLLPNLLISLSSIKSISYIHGQLTKRIRRYTAIIPILVLTFLCAPMIEKLSCVFTCVNQETFILMHHILRGIIIVFLSILSVVLLILYVNLKPRKGT